MEESHTTTLLSSQKGQKVKEEAAYSMVRVPGLQTATRAERTYSSGASPGLPQSRRQLETCGAAVLPQR